MRSDMQAKTPTGGVTRSGRTVGDGAGSSAHNTTHLSFWKEIGPPTILTLTLTLVIFRESLTK